MKSGSLILLVEDRKPDVLLLTEALKQSGLGNPVRVVDDGAKAVSYLSGQFPFSDRRKFPAPGVMLLDLSLPKMSGWEVLRWVRSKPEFKGLLVVVMTASLDASNLRRAYQMGANSFLSKPCTAEDLLSLAKGFPARWFGAERGSREAQENVEGGHVVTVGGG